MSAHAIAFASRPMGRDPFRMTMRHYTRWDDGTVTSCVHAYDGRWVRTDMSDAEPQPLRPSLALDLDADEEMRRGTTYRAAEERSDTWLGVDMLAEPDLAQRLRQEADALYAAAWAEKDQIRIRLARERGLAPLVTPTAPEAIHDPHDP